MKTRNIEGEVFYSSSINFAIGLGERCQDAKRKKMYCFMGILKR